MKNNFRPGINAAFLGFPARNGYPAPPSTDCDHARDGFIRKWRMLEDATIVITDGKITALHEDIPIPTGATG